MRKFELLKHLRENAVGIFEDGKIVLELKVQSNGKTERCAYCGCNHYHGVGDGDRVPHCSFDLYALPVDKNLVFQNRLGQLFYQRNGYVLVSHEKRLGPS
jgi:hypothetical protein